MTLADPTVDTFAARVGETFRISTGGGPTLDTSLVDVTAGAAPPPAVGRAPFSVVFRGPPSPVLPQCIYTVEHDELGASDIFLVPIGPDPEGMRYEAVFA